MAFQSHLSLSNVLVLTAASLALVRTNNMISALCLYDYNQNTFIFKTFHISLRFRGYLTLFLTAIFLPLMWQSMSRVFALRSFVTLSEAHKHMLLEVVFTGNKYGIKLLHGWKLKCSLLKFSTCSQISILA